MLNRLQLSSIFQDEGGPAADKELSADSPDQASARTLYFFQTGGNCPAVERCHGCALHPIQIQHRVLFGGCYFAKF